MVTRILLAIDGEPHTDSAVKWAIKLAAASRGSLTALHVKDPYLKQFSNDIYAQGREEYLVHVDDCLSLQADRATSRFETVIRDLDIQWTVEVSDGDPLEVLPAVVASGGYGLLVLGRKPEKGFAGWKSRDLPGKLLHTLKDVPVLVVPQVD